MPMHYIAAYFVFPSGLPKSKTLERLKWTFQRTFVVELGCLLWYLNSLSSVLPLLLQP